MQATRVYSSDPRELASMRAFVRACCRLVWVSHAREGAIVNLECAVHEAVTNVIRHAYGGERNRSVELSIEVDDDAARVTIRDTGRSFDPAAVPPPAFDGSRPGGFGVYLIGKLVDEVRYLRDDDGSNVARLVKNRW